jgi:hypothetical protein
MAGRSQNLQIQNIDKPLPNTMNIPHNRHSSQTMHTSSNERRSLLAGTSSHSQTGPFDMPADMELDSFISRCSSTQGTESPYHVESPSGRVSAAVSSQALPQRSNDKHSLLSGLSNPEDDPIELDPLPTNSARSINSIQNQTRPEHNPFPGIGRSSSLSEFIPLNRTHASYTPFPPRDPPTTIKSFLPVNKTTIENNSWSHNVKDPQSPPHSLFSNRLIVAERALASSYSPTSMHGTHITPLHSSITTSRSLNSKSPVSDLTDSGVESSTETMAEKKRKTDSDDLAQAKKQKLDTANKAKRIPKSKEPKPEPVSSFSIACTALLTSIQAKYRLGQDLWMLILEFTPPSFLRKARLLNKEFKSMVDQYESIFVNQRKANYGEDMPDAPTGLTQRQYNDLLGGKGCLERGCDDEKASRTHWSWAKRWCWNCWKSKIEREDRVIKMRQNQYGRSTIQKMLECIPVGMHDSFLKPHDFIDDVDGRPRGAPRLYKYYLKEDVEKIIVKYEALAPPPYVEDPTHTPAQKASALAAYQALMSELDQKRTDFFAEEKKKNDEHMATVQKIEAAIRKRRELNRNPYDDNRKARKELFTRRAQEDIPHIPTEFVQSAVAFKAATRIFRDGGTERGWQTLKPKIEKEWEKRGQETASTSTKSIGLSQAEDGGDTEGDDVDSVHEMPQMDVSRDSSNPIGFSGQFQHRHAQFPPQMQRQRMPGQPNQTLGSSMVSPGGMYTSSLYGNGFGPSINRQYLTPATRKVPTGMDVFTNYSVARGINPGNIFSTATSSAMPNFASSYASHTRLTNEFHSNSIAQLPSTQIPISSLLGPPIPPRAPTYNPNPYT